MTGEPSYASRTFSHLGPWQGNGTRIKAYGIEAVPGSLSNETRAEAEAIAAAAYPEDNQPGFAILHRGEEAVWLLLHWWMPGGILAQRLWRRDLGEGAAFGEVDRPLMACVWELLPIAFKRDAYVSTLLGGGSRADYDNRIMPEGLF